MFVSFVHPSFPSDVLLQYWYMKDKNKFDYQKHDTIKFFRLMAKSKLENSQSPVEKHYVGLDIAG